MRAKTIENHGAIIKVKFRCAPDHALLKLHLVIAAEDFGERSPYFSGTVLESNDTNRDHHTVGFWSDNWNIHAFEPLEDLCEPKK